MKYTREKSILLKGLDKPFFEALLENDAFIAGGAIASVFSNKQINDYDVYFHKPSDYEKAVYKFSDLVRQGKCTITFKSSNAVTYKTNTNTVIQLVSFKFGSPIAIFSSFDFTCCMGSYSLKSGDFLLHPEFLQHLSQRRLVYNTANGFPLSTLFRVRKFTQKKGYHIDAISLVKIALSIHKLDLNNKEELHRQLSGVSTHILEDLMKKLERKLGEPYDFEEIVEWLEETGDVQGNTSVPNQSTEEISQEIEDLFN